MGIVRGTVIVAVLAIVGCGTTSNKEPAAVYTPKNVEQISTLEFIPTLKKDKKGHVVPYKVAANPYLSKRGVINKASIQSFVQAKRAYKVAEYETAETALKSVLQQSPKLSGPWVMLGDIALQKDELVNAKENYSRAINLNKQNMNAYIRLAKVQRMLGEFSQAKEVYAAALNEWKDFPEAHLNLGVLYDVYLNDSAKAQKHIEAYQFLTNGENEEVAVWLEEIQQRTGEPTQLKVQKEGLIVKPVT